MSLFLTINSGDVMVVVHPSLASYLRDIREVLFKPFKALVSVAAVERCCESGSSPTVLSFKTVELGTITDGPFSFRISVRAALSSGQQKMWVHRFRLWHNKVSHC